MDKQKRQRQDRLQNVLIVLLSVAAVGLFALTQAELLHWELLPADSALDRAGQESVSAGASRLQELDWPVTLVSGDGAGDRRCQQLSTADSAFTAVESLWEDALRQAQSPRELTRNDFQAALAQPELYVAFPSPVPACVLAARLGLSSDDETALRRLLLAAEGESVQLLFDTGERCYVCGTDLSADELTSLIAQLGGDDCLFAFEQEEESALDPLTVLPVTLPQYQELNIATAEEPVTEELLRFFGFSTHTNNRYTDSSGTEVVVESPRRLSVTAAGEISYQGTVSYAPELFCLSDAAQPTLLELVDGAYSLLLQFPGAFGGEERLTLDYAEYDRAEGICTLRFSYMVGGLPLRYGDGSAAAELTVEGGTVTSLSFRRRSYTAGDSASLLLPVTQAVAIAEGYPGQEMALSYVDGGGAHAAAAWLMR